MNKNSIINLLGSDLANFKNCPIDVFDNPTNRRYIRTILTMHAMCYPTNNIVEQICQADNEFIKKLCKYEQELCTFRILFSCDSTDNGLIFELHYYDMTFAKGLFNNMTILLTYNEVPLDDIIKTLQLHKKGLHKDLHTRFLYDHAKPHVFILFGILRKELLNDTIINNLLQLDTSNEYIIQFLKSNSIIPKHLKNNISLCKFSRKCLMIIRLKAMHNRYELMEDIRMGIGSALWRELRDEFNASKVMQKKAN